MNDVTIIGTGPAGLTAGIYAARGGMKTVIYAGTQHGGQLTTTTEIENFPGFKDPIAGPQLMNDMAGQAERVGATIVYDEITRVDFKNSPFTLWAGDQEIKTKTVIIATGASAKTLGIPGEWELMGKGVSTCATCDGFFYKGKKVAVVGGGDTAMEEATYLAKLASEVILLHRRDVFKASTIMLKRAQSNPKIKFMVPYAVVEPKAKEGHGLYGIVVENLNTKKREELAVDGLFMAVGHSPNSKPFRDFLDTDENGYLTVENYTQTKVPGVFAAGDIADHTFRQAVTAAGMGCQAAMQAIRWLEGQG